MTTAHAPAWTESTAARSLRLAPGRWLAWLAAVLVGYALFGKGFAYIGLPPLFIGEATLVAGLACLLTVRPWQRALAFPGLGLLALLWVWGAACTLPYLGRYGLDAVRDAVLIGYSLIAVAVGGMILAEPARLATLVRWYRAAAPWLLVGVLALFAFERVFRESLPRWPWADVAVIDLKAGDCLVHVAGVLAFWATGLAGRVPVWQVAVMAAAIAAMGSENRGGLVTLLFVLTGCIALRPKATPIRNLLIIVALALGLLLAVDVSVKLPDHDREVSARQVVLNIASIVIEDPATRGLQGTKEWRLNWWGDVINYTCFGEHFWTGKGFGVNLADDDGYQVNDDGSLRSPHNSHLSVLARAGVPGLVLWFAVLASWAWTLLRARQRALLLGQPQWAGLFMFLLLYGGAFLVVASFDVVLEGPMCGLWFWTLYGVGVAAARVHRNEHALR